MTASSSPLCTCHSSNGLFDPMITMDAGEKSQIQQVESFAVGVGGGEPLGADRHSRLVAHDHEHAILGLDVGELVEHRLHSPVIQLMR